jgi:hypothetical protein
VLALNDLLAIGVLHSKEGELSEIGQRAHPKTLGETFGRRLRRGRETRAEHVLG